MAGTSGYVHRLNARPYAAGERGIPKHAIEQCTLSRDGIEGDHCHHRKRHELDRAVLLLPLETILELKDDWYPVEPGHLGENITTQGITQDIYEPGQLWQIGGQAVIKVTKKCEPCNYLGVLPYVGEKNLTDFKAVLKGRRGWYASVEVPGQIHRGDPVALLDP